MTEQPAEIGAENAVTELFGDAARARAARLRELANQFTESASAADVLRRSASIHATNIANTYNERTRENLDRMTANAESVSGRVGTASLAQDWMAYARDYAERFLLTVDTLRERGDIFVEHEAAGCPPVLAYEYEVALDGKDLPRPCNYMLLKIVPPAGITIDETKRPYIIIDPRAGHGAGIGGFKSDSQVGVALARGNPVYFVGFRRDPMPGQTLADVTRAEAAFVREVMRRHPESPKPVVAGNCQGGWATLLLAATNPDLTGPIVLNGAPVATWSGKVGKDPMRYNAGVLGGTWESMFFSDIGGGVFDGAHLVQNFELQNPSRSYFSKYYDLFSKIDTERERFLEFEKWWGGFFRLNEAEIRWIVEELFVGNKVVKNTAQLEPGRPLDLKAIRAPIIVFASYGDNITPPQQALNWIVDTYADVDEIRIRGQRIIYILHEEIGHLGIFVSSKVAKKEHTQVASTMRTIETLAPGLYEMKVEATKGEGIDRQFEVSFFERTLDDLRTIDDDRGDEAAFGAVARASEAQAEIYDTMLRPMVKAMVTPQSAELGRTLHPLRMQRAMMSSKNPFMAPLGVLASAVNENRKPLAADNPFRMAETAQANLVTQTLDMYRDVRDAMYEMSFFSLWNAPWARQYGKSHDLRRTLKDPSELQSLPEVVIALGHIASGGFVEAVVRMLILLAESRGSVRRDRLERAAQVLSTDEPFASLAVDERARIIHEQTLIVTFAQDQAIETLKHLLPDAESRELALKVVQYVPGRLDEMAPHTLEMLQKIRQVLGLAAASEDITVDPLGKSDAGMGTAAE